MGARIFHVTYDTVTPESAAQGDYAESGFLTPHGRQDMADLSGEAAGEVKAACALTLDEAVNLFGDRFHKGYLETDFETVRWPEFLYSNHQNGEQERLALHAPSRFNMATLARYLERN